MGSASSERYVSSTVIQSVKILVVGAFGVGKTTLIGSVSEIAPLRTEETMTAASVGVDSLAGLDSKSTTTVAMDFGRITLTPEIVLYLFGTPGQKRFWNLWEGLSDGAVGALVLVDPRRLEDSFEVFDQLELHTKVPFAVAVNQFPGSPQYSEEQLREALDLLPETPIVFCDARERKSAAQTLVKLVEYAIEVRNKSEVA
ncbi:ATP/GTP-binding protein [Saccharomonospora sp. NB11]|jgi:signal recognition particle receptor subunit beta|uniref:GTP-binding protein n=1 Tax=Saccharomonospora sp. NB11 TaxID=1642298 RepID=UPI0018D00AB6|nr:ATP/GTP-binding protein [Saccharomonospora sp. NB11]